MSRNRIQFNWLLVCESQHRVVVDPSRPKPVSRMGQLDLKELRQKHA